VTHVLVTGGAGFIASHIVDAYATRGWRVSVIDDLSTGDRRNLDPRAELHVADLRDPSTADLIKSIGAEVISHHAAQVDVRKSVADPAFDAETNIVATLRLFESAIDAGAKRIIFASTGGAIYGEPQDGPQDELHPTQPLSPYGCAKLAVESYLHYFSAMRGVSYVALRYANVYGPRQNAKGEAGVVAIFARALLAGETPTINGTGEQTRDYVYVGDVVSANIAATDGDFSGAYNVGTGIETSVNELFAIIANVSGTIVAAPHGPAKAGEQMRSVLDGRRLRSMVHMPQPLALVDGLRRTIDWFRANPR
jgi:UDP-glucose 4-epimerase